MPARILQRHVGGNTTYARKIAAGLAERSIDVALMPAGGNPAATMALETMTGLRRGSAGDVLHYVADTGPLLSTRRPSVVTVHGVASRWIDVARSAAKDRLWRTRVARAIASTDRVLTVSESSANDIAEVFGVPRGDVDVIPHGIDAAAFQAPRELSAEVSAAVPSEFVLYVGNIEPRKNLAALIRAFQTPEVLASGVPLVIAGRPAWDFEEVVALADAAPNVIRLGFVSDDDRVALMQRCALFVFPSLYEGFGFPVLEALAAGAPVAASRRGSLAEVAGPAATFDGVDVDAIAATLASLLGDADALDAARDPGAAWSSSFSWERSVERHVAAYEAVLA